MLASSDWLVVSGVVSEHPVELHVINFVCGLGLESLVNEVELARGDYYFHVIEDGSESGVGNKSTVALVLILEEWLDQESSVSDVSADSLQAGFQVSLFTLGQLVLWVEDRWSLESIQSFGGVLLKVFLCENAFDFLIKPNVVHLGGVLWASEMVFEELVFLSGQL